MIKLSKHNLLLTIRRLIGISILSIIVYCSIIFFIKLVFYLMYLGVTIVNNFFSWIVGG